MSEAAEMVVVTPAARFLGRSLAEWQQIESDALDNMEWETACDALQAINELRKGTQP